MKTAVAALFLCLAASAAQAQDAQICRSIHDASERMIEATEAQIEALSQLDFEDTAVVLRVEDRNIAYAMVRARNETLEALTQLRLTQKQFLGALERCS
jgi:hypothetical protein